MTNCKHCGRDIEQSGGRGRPREYCSSSCKQLDYKSRADRAAHDDAIREEFEKWQYAFGTQLATSLSDVSYFYGLSAATAAFKLMLTVRR